MPESRLARTRAAYLPTYERYLEENIKSGRFPFTPQGVADCIDDAVGRAVYGGYRITNCEGGELQIERIPLDEQ